MCAHTTAGRSPGYVLGLFGAIAVVCGLSASFGYTVLGSLSPAVTAVAVAGAAGAVVGDEAQDITTLSFPFPLALVLGSEGGGIRKGLQKRLDLRVRIPMRGVPLSFNVSMACAIFLHEIAKQTDSA